MQPQLQFGAGHGMVQPQLQLGAAQAFMPQPMLQGPGQGPAAGLMPSQLQLEAGQAFLPSNWTTGGAGNNPNGKTGVCERSLELICYT